MFFNSSVDANVRAQIARLRSAGAGSSAIDAGAVDSALDQLRDVFIPSSLRDPLGDGDCLAELWALVVAVFLHGGEGTVRENAASLLVYLLAYADTNALAVDRSGLEAWVVENAASPLARYFEEL